MHKKKKVTIIVLVILCIGLVISLISATTYALFSYDTYGTNQNSYSTGMLSIEAKSKSEIISLTSALPMTDEDGKNTTPYVFTIINTGNLDYEFDVKLLSTGDASNTFDSSYIKLQIDDGDVVTLSSLTNGVIKSDVNLAAGESIDISLRVWLSMDTPNTQLGKTFNSKIVTDGQAVYKESNNESVTPLSDFTYFLGSEYSTVDTINYYDSDTDAYYDIAVAPMTLESNEVLLVKYKGTSKAVYVPDTYTVDDTTYNVIMLSWVYINYNDGEIDTDDGVFEYNTSIESVTLGKNIKFIVNDGYTSVTENSMIYMFSGCTSLVNAPEIPSSVTDMDHTFSGCTSLVNVPVIPSSVTNMDSTFSFCTSLVNAPEIPSSVTNMNGTFYGCTSLVNAPVIPSSVTSMSDTFSGCTSLVNAPEIPSSVTSMNSTFSRCTSLVNAPVIPSSVTSMNGTFSGCTSLVNAPEIPSSVTNMDNTFSGCTSLVNAPVIPSSVTNMGYTFSGCTSLVNAPEIPSSVTNMNRTFSGCTSLTGTVKINSSSVSRAVYIFRNTTNDINVLVPSGSTTYTTFSKLTTSNGMPSNVTLSTY